MNIIENWTNISGNIVSSQEDQQKPGFMLLVIKILSSSNHESFPNLLKTGKDGSIQVKIKGLQSDKKNLKGGKITATVRAAPGNIYFAKVGSVQIDEK